MKIKSNHKGITLIALIITIIVLLILAGVTINTLFDNGNVIDKAGQAKEEISHGTVKEKFSLGLMDFKLEKSTKGLEKTSIEYFEDEEYMANKDGEDYYIVQKKGLGDVPLGKGTDKTTGDVYVVEKKTDVEEWILRYYKTSDGEPRDLLSFTLQGQVTKDYLKDGIEDALRQAIEESKNPDGSINEETLKGKLDELNNNGTITGYEKKDGGYDVFTEEGTYHIDIENGELKKLKEGSIQQKDPIYTKDTRPEDYIPIYTREDLEQVGTGNTVIIEQEENRSVLYTIDANYILMDNIDLSGENWNPIQNEITGTFEGNNRMISNMKIEITTGGDYGIFAKSKAAIDNLYVTDVNITTNESVSGDINIGSIVGIQADNDINNCETSGTITSTVSLANIGGLVGSVTKSCDMSNVVNRINITGNDYIGGIVGYYSATSHFTINDSENYGKLTGNRNVGGMVGYVNCTGAQPYDIKQCTNNGTLIADVQAGGIVGYSNGVIMANNNTNNGNVEGSGNIRYYLGGIVGGVYTTTTNTVVLQYNTNNGNITGYRDFGGIVGQVSTGNLQLGYNNNYGKIESTNSNASKCYEIGGIVGQVYGDIANSVTIVNNINNESINVNNGEEIGGIAGEIRFNSGNQINIPNNTNETGGIITLRSNGQNSSSIGGIVGFLYSPVTYVIANTNKANINCINESGTNNIITYVAGIVGDDNKNMRF